MRAARLWCAGLGSLVVLAACSEDVATTPKPTTAADAAAVDGGQAGLDAADAKKAPDVTTADLTVAKDLSAGEVAEVPLDVAAEDAGEPDDGGSGPQDGGVIADAAATDAQAADVPPPQCVTATDCTAAAPGCQQWDCVAGSCAAVPLADGATCSDNDACSVGDACKAGECLPGTPTVCTDGNPCTADACDKASGACKSTPAAGFCDDGNPCTDGDTCKDGGCAGGPPLKCDDQNPCTADSCDSGSKGGCVQLPIAATCDDGDACTGAGSCAAGKCQSGTAIACKDGNLCTDDGCDKAKGCVYLPNAATCSDAAKCLLGTCSGGACAAGTKTGCDDGNPCTTDTCDAAKGCIFSPVAGTPTCGKGDACAAAPTCIAGQCMPGVKTDCDDKNPCTDDACDPATGCKWSPNSTQCSDGNPCTAPDVCSVGKCIAGKPIDPKVGCSDGNVCTDDSCDPAKGCQNLANKGVCDDGDACTQGDACVDKVCKPVGSPCDDGNPCTADQCDAKTGACSWGAKTGACDDGDACTVGDACGAGKCVPGAKTVCNDGEPCTTDSCDPKGGCVTTVVAGGGALACDGVQSGAWCWKATAANTTWAQAEQACVTWGGHLARIDSAAENTVVRNVATGVCGGNSTPWIGLSDQAVEGKFVWSDGSTPAYTNWGGNQPDNCVGCCSIANAGEDVVQMFGNGTWNDLCAATALGCYVCRRPAPAVACADDAKCLAGGTCVAGKCTGAKTSCDDKNPCTVDSCGTSGCSHVAVAANTPCGTGGVCTAGVCSPGADPSNPIATCATAPGGKDGTYWLDPDGSGPEAPVQAACSFGLDGGGWTLLVVYSDDGANHWTWNQKALWSSDKTVFGALTDLAKDYKSPLLHSLPFKDVLFVHAPSTVWASYHDVGDGKLTFAAKMAPISNTVCYQPKDGFAMSAGTLKAGAVAGAGQLCSTNMYLSMSDHDGNVNCGDNDHGWGPGWSTSVNNPCPFDDPGTSSLGGLFADPGAEPKAGNGKGYVGFGWALGLNSGAANSGQNRIAMWVR